MTEFVKGQTNYTYYPKDNNIGSGSDFTVDQSLAPTNTGITPTTSGGDSIWQNKLFLQYLASMGKDIGGGDPSMSNVNAVTQQNIQSQNIMKMMQQALGPDQSKLTADSTGLSFKTPTSSPEISTLLGLNLGGNNKNNILTNPNPSVAPVGTVNANTPITKPATRTLNPFASSQTAYPASDLAGLTPQDIMQVFGAQQAKETLANRQVQQVYDQIYKTKQMQHIDSQIAKESAEAAKAGRPEPLDQLFPISGPNGTSLTTRQWEKLPDTDKQYLVYLHGEKVLGGKEPMTKTEWENTKPTEKERFLNAILKRPELKDIAFKYAKAGATNISLDTKLAEKKAMGGLEGQLYFDNPKWIEDVNKHLESKSIRRTIATSDKPQQASAKEKVNFIESKIIGSGGKIVDVKRDGKIGTWVVQWPSGDTKEIRHALYD